MINCNFAAAISNGAHSTILPFHLLSAAWMQDDKETYLLLILSDANLPTGSFVASAGLESTATHALFHAPTGTGTGGTSDGHPASSSSVSDILAFLHNSVDTYARSALPFARDAHRIT